MRWFKKTDYFYWPVSWPGWVFLFFFWVYFAGVFVLVDTGSHSAGDTLRGLALPYILGFALASFVLNSASDSGKE